MIDGLRAKHRSMFTIRVGPQRITFMIGECPPTSTATATVDATALTTTPHLQVPSRSFSSSSRRTRCSTRRPAGFTIPVFGKGIVYDSPLDERQQQVKLLVH